MRRASMTNERDNHPECAVNQIVHLLQPSVPLSAGFAALRGDCL